MLNYKSFIIMLSIIVYIPSSFASFSESKDQVLKVVDKMNSAWLEQDLPQCISYFSIDTSFENSYGWSISSRKSLEHFLQGFIFAKFPKIEKKYVHTSSTVEFLAPDIALVEEAKRIDLQDSNYKAIFVRTNFILKQVEGKWLIWKTRSWTPKPHNDPPKEFVIPNKYPAVFNWQ